MPQIIDKEYEIGFCATKRAIKLNKSRKNVQ